MGIPGESLVWSANQFIHWLNSHPYCSSLSFDLSQSKKAVIVGNGNVAMDVARLLLKSPSQLAQTDIAPYALEALKQSTIEQIHIVARRGPSHVIQPPC
jgi:NADPH-dependent glutamate synthase beta subunit-like oxidoreductase